MNMPARPTYQTEDPLRGGSCLLMVGGERQQFGWTNCTCVSCAMGIEKSTLGRLRPTGCQIRIQTGDRSGGTMLSQVASVAENEYGVDVTVRVGSNCATTDEVAKWLHQGRGLIAQGNAGALLDTTFRSTQGFVNHAVWFNEGRGWHTNKDGVTLPKEVFVYDPAANGRHAGWGKADQGPSWWDWGTCVEFMGKLRPRGDNSPVTLGRGRAYVAVFPDTEPHVHLRYSGSHATSPLPREFVVVSPVPHEHVNVRSGPSAKYDVIKTKKNGTIFVAYQRNDNGQKLNGSRTWWGNHTGRRWVHDSGLEPK